MSSIRQKSPIIKGSSTPEGSLTPARSIDAPIEDGLDPKSQIKQRRANVNRSWVQRFDGTVIGVLLIFVFIYNTVTLCVILPWLSYSVPGVLNLASFTLETGTALWCFLLCVIVDPGRVPDDYEPDLEANSVVQVKRKGGEVRYCQKCCKPKPPRTHHCKVCKRCVLRMDHHCPWIGNCVGHGNYKSFLLFLIYVSMAIVHALGLLCAHALYWLRMHGENRQHSIRTGPAGTVIGAAGQQIHTTVFWAVTQTVCLAFSMPLTIGLVMLLAWNLYLALQNKTTIEFHEGVTAKIKASQSGGGYHHPYDLGHCGNLHAICGANPLLWSIPDRAAGMGDGTAFPTSWESVVDHSAFGL